MKESLEPVLEGFRYEMLKNNVVIIQKFVSTRKYGITMSESVCLVWKNLYALCWVPIHFSRNAREIQKIPNPKISKSSKYPSENRKKSSKIFRSLTYLNIIFSFQKGQSMAGTQEIREEKRCCGHHSSTI